MKRGVGVMRILGVDPGLRFTGYGFIEIPEIFSSEDQMRLLEAGFVKTPDSTGIADRLLKIFDGLGDAIDEIKPDVMVLEKLYAHYKHPATAILMGHARGTVCLLGGVKKVPLLSIASTHVKKSVSGHGHAGKLQMQRMVQHYLGLKKMPQPADVADALAVAISYAFTLKKK